MKPEDSPPLVAHVIHALGTGGLENGLVNLINRTPPARYRHAVVCLTDADPFAQRITRSDVPIVSLNRKSGHSFALYGQLWSALRRLRPSIVHTRNLSALEAQIPAFLLPGVRRVHGEHGRDLFDLHGTSRKYNLLRRAVRPLVQRYIAVSRDLERWLIDTVGAAPARVRQIYNGVDQEHFFPRSGARPDLAPPGFLPADGLLIGTVGRLAGVKDQRTLVRAFAALLSERPGERGRLRLLIVGDGPLRKELEAEIQASAIAEFVWLPGDRDDVPELLRLLDLFVLPSLGEGISNTILEAMACALPVIATRVGGNPELVDEGRTGTLVPPGDVPALTRAIAGYLDEPAQLRTQGQGGLAKVRERFRWERCVEDYLGVYDELLAGTAAVPLAARKTTGTDC
jgi:sugar transferase (PEP-CTERM/EpsH1 system associated)